MLRFIVDIYTTVRVYLLATLTLFYKYLDLSHSKGDLTNIEV